MTSPPHSRICPTSKHQHALSRLLSASLDDDLTRWLVPDSATRHQTITLYVEALADHGTRHAQVCVPATAGPPQAALVYSRISSLYEHPDWAPRLATATGRWRGRFEALHHSLRQPGLSHPQPGEPHRRIDHVAIAPNGHAAAELLLDHLHAYVGEAGVPVYAPALHTRTRDWLIEQGYQGLHPVQLPHDGPYWWPMWRPADHQPPRTR